jgi:predicted membrane-bound spermidine synthase
MNSGQPKDWLWQPSLIVFISNACVMVVELVAGRIVAPFIGVSLYTWTTIIGVILAGMSIGNFVGGKLADKYASRRLLGMLFILAGLGSISVLIMVSLLGEKGLMSAFSGMPLIARMVFYISAMFLIPSILLGTISPLVVKLSLQDLSKSGNLIGRIYAMSALGSILGTFATGFYLIQWFGTRSILLGVGVLLVVMGILLGQWTRNRGAMARSAVMSMIVSTGIIASFVLTPAQTIMASPCYRETNYFCIRVRADDYEGTTYQVLTLDRLVHSYTAIDDPSKLRYAYEWIGAEVLDYMKSRYSSLNAMFIGGGGYTLPKYIEHVYPGAKVEVVEIDPGVTETAYDRLGLARNTPIVSHNEDARQFLVNREVQKKYNLIAGDAFNDFSVPYHLTTKEFNDLVQKNLSDDGIYMLNLIDGNDQPFVGAFIRTLRQTFKYVYLVPTHSDWKSLVRSTFIVLASNKPLDITAFAKIDAGDGTPHVNVWLENEAVMNEITSKSTLILTDNFVPTDQLLMPMFEASAK